MILKPQDVVVLLKLVALGDASWTYQRLATELSLSPSEAHAGVRRAVAAKLMTDAKSATGRPVREALKEFLLHGVKYAFSPERGALTRGVPTGYAAPPLNREIAQGNDPPPVWPHAQGQVRGGRWRGRRTPISICSFASPRRWATCVGASPSSVAAQPHLQASANGWQADVVLAADGLPRPKSTPDQVPRCVRERE